MDFEVEVHDKTLTRLGWLGSAQSIVVTPRHNQQPTGSLTVASDHELVPAMSTEGARVVIRYRGEHVMSGPLRLVEGELGPTGTLTYQVQDDWRLFRRILGWQVPAAAVTAQGTATDATYTGPAETVLKNIVQANLTRLGGALQVPVTVATTQGRGSTITVTSRMHALADRLFPLVDQAGIGTTVKQVGTGLVVDCYVPQTWPITLSQEAGTITEGSWTRTPPELTRVVVGGPGEGAARIFRMYANTTLEALWGDVIEGFVDARDIKADDPALESLMQARGNEALAAGAAKAGLSLRLSETEVFRAYGDGIRVGDRVTAQVAPGLTITDVIREATLAQSVDAGTTATPVLGERADDDSALVRVVAAVARSVRDLRVRS